MKFYTNLFFLFFSLTVFSQNSISEVLKKSNNATVPYIRVNEMKSIEGFVLLDTRETNEFNVSHISNAINVGYDNFNKKQIGSILKQKSTPIIVYCSIGIRSERIGEKLLKMGYTNVKNLYGGIFEWKNKGYEVVDTKNKKTEKVHAFSKEWSVYLTSGNAVYDR